jgi:hypothetical protein
MTAESRPFLDYDSFVDCSSMQSLSSIGFFEKFVADPSIHIGTLTEPDYKIIREAIKGAFTIKAADKKDYGLFL